MNLYTIFQSFFITEKLSLDNEKILDFCLDQKKLDKRGLNISNSGGWQSEKLNFKAKEIWELVQEIEQRLPSIKILFDLKEKTYLYVDNGWININGRGHSNIPHVHPLSFLSAVYYVRVPKDSGKLILDNPSPQHDFVVPPEIIKNFNTYNSSYWSVPPNENDLIFFPSWIKHRVESNQNDEDRISIAFNIKLDWKNHE